MIMHEIYESLKNIRNVRVLPQSQRNERNNIIIVCLYDATTEITWMQTAESTKT